MKIHQIISESEVVNEVPGRGMLKRGLAKVGAKMAGAVGAKGVQAKVQGGLDADARGKELYKSWMAYAGQTQADEKTPTKAEVADFMATQKMPTGQLNKHKDGPLPAGAIDTILQGAAQDSFKGKAGQAAVGQGDSPEPETAGEKWGAQPGGEAGAKAGGGAPGEAGAKAGGGKVPQNLQKQIDALNPQQKQELVKLL
jgi:hypothetical protein